MFSTNEMFCVFGCDVIVMLRFDKNVILHIMTEHTVGSKIPELFAVLHLRN